MKMMGICSSYRNGGAVFGEQNENEKSRMRMRMRMTSSGNLLKVLKRTHGDSCCLFHGFCYGSNGFLWIAVVVGLDLVTSHLKQKGNENGDIGEEEEKGKENGNIVEMKENSLVFFGKKKWKSCCC